MKITVYTVTDCQFSKAEKEYLKQHNFPYEEKNLEQNREWLTEMLAVSNNFAGTPVTKIEKDDGSIVVLKGFTQEEFDKELGLNKTQTVAQTNAQINPPSSTPSNPPSPIQSPVTQQSTSPTSNQSISSPSVQPVSTNQPISTPSPTSTPNVNQAVNEQDNNLNNILQNLQEKAETPNSSQSPPSPPLPGDIPNIPDFNDQNQ